MLTGHFKRLRNNYIMTGILILIMLTQLPGILNWETLSGFVLGWGIMLLISDYMLIYKPSQIVDPEYPEIHDEI